METYEEGRCYSWSPCDCDVGELLKGLKGGSTCRAGCCIEAWKLHALRHVWVRGGHSDAEAGACGSC